MVEWPVVKIMGIIEAGFSVRDIDPLLGRGEAPVPDELQNRPPETYTFPEDRASTVLIKNLYDVRGRVTSETVHSVTEALTEGNFVVGDFLSTYGFIFLDNGREKVAKVKGEETSKPVSVVASLEDMLDWIDFDRIHPEFKFGRDEKAIARKLGRAFSNVAFLRIPVNKRGCESTKWGISQTKDKNGRIENYMQVLVKNDDDPILAQLRKQNANQKLYLVTSLNPHGELERYEPESALNYAKEIEAPIFVYQAVYSEQYADRRLRVGSLPIIEVPLNTESRPSGAGLFTIKRAANTHPYSVTRAIKQVFPWAAVMYQPDKEDGSMYSAGVVHKKDKNGIVWKLPKDSKFTRKEYYSVPETTDPLTTLMRDASDPEKLK